MTGPDVASAGIVVLIVESLQLDTFAGTPLNVTVPDPCVDPKALPVIVTVDPVVLGVGETEPIDGERSSGIVMVES